MMRFSIYVIALLSVLSASGQNAREDMRRISEAYTKHPNMSMGIEYNVFVNHTAETPIETSAGSYCQQSGIRYNRLNEIESVQNKEFSLIIDNEEKMIVIGNPVKFNTGKIGMTDLDTAFAKYSSIKFLPGSGSQKGYSFIIKPMVISEHDRVDVFFNAKTFAVESMVFYYRNKEQLVKTNRDAPEEKPRLEITFSSIKFELSPEAKFYSESRFIGKKDGRFVPTSAYSGYKVIDQRIKQ